MTMHIRVQIIRWISDDFPGYAECRFADRFDREWTIIEKAPVLTVAHLAPDSEFPQPGLVACEIIARHQDDAGREIADVTTSIPWGTKATDGTTSFQLYTEQLRSE
ncbi:hypothetical protein [Bradyrhizobium sp. C9]|uniref:hypothetical protein n=1 Tax=Bradyrhizobium sp. C9 TaxID=142585 RepID=UPI0011773C4C|nr:hypothetical protein [Bradyrhizobium sp. C9]